MAPVEPPAVTTETTGTLLLFTTKLEDVPEVPWLGSLGVTRTRTELWSVEKFVAEFQTIVFPVPGAIPVVAPVRAVVRIQVVPPSGEYSTVIEQESLLGSVRL